MTDPGQKPPTEPEFGLIAGAVIGLVVWLAIEAVGMWTLGVGGHSVSAAVVYLLPKMFPHGFGGVMPATIWPTAALAIAHRWSIGGLALGGAVGGAIFFWFATPAAGVRHLRGRQLRKGAALAKQEARAEGKPTGIYLHPKIQISERRETRHFFIGGASGSGKTTVILPIFEQARARGDKLIVWDYKGDIWQAGGPAVLLAPWDARSHRWIPGADINTIPRARALAQFLIPANGNNPMWEMGTQQILVAVLSSFLPRQWTFSELGAAARTILTDMDSLKGIINDEMPEAQRIIASGKPSESILFTLSVWFTAVFDLAEADRALAHAGRPTLALRRWLDHKNPAPLIFRPNPDDPPEDDSGAGGGLGRQFVALAINLLAGYVLMMPDAPPEQRRIWFFLDEVSHIAKLNVITEMLEAGRSKGARVILGLQEPSQITKKYSAETLKIWENTTATKILVQMTGTDAQEWAARTVGEREVERYVGQMSAGANWGSNQQASRSSSWQRAEERLLLPAEFAQIVQPSAAGVRGILLMSGDAHLLTWPHLDPQPKRSAFEPAAWTLPGWQRAHRAAAAPTNHPDDEDSVDIGQPQRPMLPRPPTGGQAKQRRPAHAEIAPPAPDRVATSEVAPTPAPDEPVADVAAEQVQDAALDHIAPGLGAAVEAVGEISEALGPDPVAPSAAPAPGMPARRKWRRRAPDQEREAD